jgi:hypothetical protein
MPVAFVDSKPLPFSTCLLVESCRYTTFGMLLRSQTSLKEVSFSMHYTCFSLPLPDGFSPMDREGMCQEGLGEVSKVWEIHEAE